MTCQDCHFLKVITRRKMCLHALRAFRVAGLERKACGNCGPDGRNWQKKEVDSRATSVQH